MIQNMKKLNSYKDFEPKFKELENYIKQLEVLIFIQNNLQGSKVDRNIINR